MRSAKTIHLTLLFLIIGFNSACTGQGTTDIHNVDSQTEKTTKSATITPLPPPPPQPTKDWSGVPSHKALLKITTSSDWTTVRLSKGTWHSHSLVSKSENSQVGELNDDLIQLQQSISRANANQQVELILEVSFANLELNDIIVFEIERGNIGSTQMEISKIVDNSPEYVTEFSWEATQPSGSNSEEFEVAAEALLSPAANEYVVISQINFWYYGPGISGGFENGDGSRDTPLTPRLGYTYAAGDPEVVYQQIEWAVEYGVDAFSIEWTTPRGVGCCGSMEAVLDDVFLKSPNIHKVRWVIFYDFILRLMQTGELEGQFTFPVNFDQPAVYETFVDDFVHFAEKYFDHPQYLKIDGRPVIYIWATNSYQGDLSGAIREARERVADLGYDVFIVGDEVCLGCFNAQHASQFDGSSTFTFLIPGVDQFALDDVGEAAEAVDYAFEWWKNQMAGLKVAGRDDLVNFQPAWAPQYDESWVKDRNNPMIVRAQSKDQVLQMAEVAKKHAEPVGENNMKLIWVNTWNCWGESTTIEPTADEGPKYPGGNYGFDFLEVIQEVYGRETYYTSPLR